MSGAKRTMTIATTIIAVISLLSTGVLYISRTNRVLKNPETAPDVAIEIIEKEIVDPIVTQANRPERLLRFIVSLPTQILFLLLLAYSYFKR